LFPTKLSFLALQVTVAICKVGDYGAIHYQATQHLMRATALE